MTRTLLRNLAVAGVALAAAASVGAATKFYPGVVKRELFNDIGGTAVADLTGSAKYTANAPDRVTFPAMIDSPDEGGANYGGRLTGFIIPTASAKYRLYVAGDDQCILYLSTDATAANLREIAREPAWNGYRDFANPPANTDAGNGRPGCVDDDPATDCENESDLIQLNAGVRYYFQVLWKEGGGGDSVSVAWVKEGEEVADGDANVIGAANIGVESSDTPSIFPVKASSSWAYIGNAVNLTVAEYAPPGVTTTLQWYKDGAAIAGATTTAYTYASPAADAGKTISFTVKQTSGGTTLESAAATVKVIDPGTPVLSPGFLKMDVWTGLSTSDNNIDSSLLADPDYPATPDYTSYTSAFSSRPVYPDDSHEGYGGRISGFITPTESGDYRFFIYSDDSSRLYLSTDDKPANLNQIAEETGCCNNFTEPDSPRTSDPQSLVAGKKYYIEGIWKEGTGGDYLYVAWRKEGDTTAAGSLPVIPGKFLSTMAPAGGVEINFTTQPVASANVEVAKSITLTAAATAFPINSVGYQWFKDGVAIPSANGTSYTLPLAVAADVGKTFKYKLEATTLGNVKKTSSEAVITIVPDTTAPTLSKAGSVKKAGKVEIGLLFDEGVEAASAGTKANYSLSAGTIDSVRHLAPKGSLLDPARVVIVASGLSSGQNVTVTVKNVKDLAGNAIPAAGVAKTLKVSAMTWVGVGGDEVNTASTPTSTDYYDDVVALGASSNYKNAEDFDLISGGSANWNAYDEGTFVYEEITGDFDRVVRIQYQDPTSQWARGALSVREALDEGTSRADAEGAVKPMARNLNIRFSAALQASGAAANNAYEVVDRNVTGGNYRSTPNGFGGAPTYPNAWMRIYRVGKVLHFLKSTDGVNWTNENTVDWEDSATGEPPLAAKVYVGMFYAPEYLNNSMAVLADPASNILKGSAIAQYRDYGPWPLEPLGGGDPGSVSIKVAAGSQVEITWDNSKGGELQSADSVNGPWSTVAGATSPYTTAPTGTARYYRLTN